MSAATTSRCQWRSRARSGSTSSADRASHGRPREYGASTLFPIRDLNPTHRTAFLTYLLIAANIGVFFLWQPFGEGLLSEANFLYERAAIPCELVQGRPLTSIEASVGRCIEQPSAAALFPAKNVWLAVLTSMFLHANILHLAGNMWFLWIFGDNVEDRFGRVLFIGVYVAAGVAGTLWFTTMRPGETIPIIGASGAIAGVLGAYLVMFPLRPVLAFLGFLILPVPALIFIGLWFAGQFAVIDPGVAWEAHVGGFVVGAVLALLLRPLMRTPPTRAR